MACVIDHANPTTGRCDASQRLIAAETGYSTRWVRSVLRWAEANTSFLRIENRDRRPHGQFKTNAYHVQWDALEMFWIAINQNIEATKESWRHGGVTASPEELKGSHGEGNSRVPMVRGTTGVPPKHKERTSKTESHPEWAHLPSVSDASMNEKQKRHPEGTLVGLSANQQMAESAAKARVDSYLGAFERDHLPPEAYAAAVEAEMELEGSGRAAVRAAANEAWKFRRASP